MKKLVQDVGVLIVCVSVAVIIGELITHWTGFNTQLGQGFLAAAMFYDGYKK